MPVGELTMARAALRVGVVLVPLAVVASWVLRGPEAGLTALGAVALVILNFYATGRSLAWAASFSPAVVMAVALGGFFARLVMYAVALVVLTPVQAIDGPVLAVTVAIATIVLLTYEVRLALSHAEFWWLTIDGKEAV